mgnify:CR=1 FL=1
MQQLTAPKKKLSLDSLADLIERGSESLLEALHVGAYIEELDIGDLRAAIERTDEVLLINAYENLLAGSRNHLRAFVSQINALGVDYVAQVLDQDDVNAIVEGYELPANQGFTINAGLNDAWYNPATNGQGFLITAWEASDFMFLAWFTYDTERPPEGTPSMVGEPGHRWLTAQGPYTGDTATLDVYLSSGGVFDSAEPAVGPGEPYGTMTIHFADCENGTVRYDLPQAGVSGAVPIRRIVTDLVPLCEALKTPTGQ